MAGRLPLGILAHLLRMVSWKLNAMRFGGDWTSHSFSDKVIGSLGCMFVCLIVFLFVFAVVVVAVVVVVVVVVATHAFISRVLSKS